MRHSDEHSELPKWRLHARPDQHEAGDGHPAAPYPPTVTSAHLPAWSAVRHADATAKPHRVQQRSVRHADASPHGAAYIHRGANTYLRPQRDLRYTNKHSILSERRLHARTD